jgi:hypothetical protein
LKEKQFLTSAFASENFYAVRSEAIAQLSSDMQSVQLIKSAFLDKDVAIRKAALRNVNPISLGLISEFENLLTDSSL